MENLRLESISPAMEMVFILDEVAPAWRPVLATGVMQVCLGLTSGGEVWFSCLGGSH